MSTPSCWFAEYPSSAISYRLEVTICTLFSCPLAILALTTFLKQTTQFTSRLFFFSLIIVTSIVSAAPYWQTRVWPEVFCGHQAWQQAAPWIYKASVHRFALSLSLSHIRIRNMANTSETHFHVESTLNQLEIDTTHFNLEENDYVRFFGRFEAPHWYVSSSKTTMIYWWENLLLCQPKSQFPEKYHGEPVNLIRLPLHGTWAAGTTSISIHMLQEMGKHFKLIASTWIDGDITGTRLTGLLRLTGKTFRAIEPLDPTSNSDCGLLLMDL